jgi:RTX calcium-binding nonapeptide repeat (4 copies)
MAEDIRLNLNTEFSQEDPDFAALAGGGFVAVWDDGNQDSGAEGFTGVYGRIFDSAGRPLTGEFRIAEDQRGQQFDAEVVALPDGGFVVAWESNGRDRTGQMSDDFNVFLQRFSATGERIGAQRQVTPDRDVDQRLDELVALPDGGFRIVTVASDLRTDWDVHTRRFDAEARPVGGEVLINRNVDTGLASAGVLRTPGYELAPLADGSFIAAYWEEPPGAFGDQIYTQRYDAAGDAVGARIRGSVLDGFTDNNFPRIALLEGGDRYAVAWTQEDEDDLDDLDVYVRTYDIDGNALTGPLRVNQELAEGQYLGEVVALPGGGFLVTYVSFVRQDFVDDLYEARGRIYDADGRPLTDSFYLSEFIYEDMDSLGTILLQDGTLLAGWHGGALVEEDVFAVLYGTEGTGGDDSITAVIPGDYTGRGGSDLILGSAGPDTLRGVNGPDGLGGGAGNDLLLGGNGDDALLGDADADTLAGGAGADVFLYALATDAPRGGAPETIRDFSRTEGDVIDLSLIDADTTAAGDQAFTFRGGGAFTGTPGELRYAGGTLWGDVDGDARPDFVIRLAGAPDLGAADLVA